MRSFGLYTLATFTPEETWAMLGNLCGDFEWIDPITGRKWLIKRNSKRYHTFKRSMKCVHCHKPGTHFKLQVAQFELNTTNRAHFNLYTEEGALLTRDHIIPISRGGTDSLTNLQTMCHYCNSFKGNKLPGELDLVPLSLSGISKYALEDAVRLFKTEGRLVIDNDQTKECLLSFLEELDRHRHTSIEIHKLLQVARKGDGNMASNEDNKGGGLTSRLPGWARRRTRKSTGI